MNCVAVFSACRCRRWCAARPSANRTSTATTRPTGAAASATADTVTDATTIKGPSWTWFHRSLPDFVRCPRALLSITVFFLLGVQGCSLVRSTISLSEKRNPVQVFECFPYWNRFFGKQSIFFNWFQLVWDRVFLTEFFFRRDRVRLHQRPFYRVLPGFTGFYLVLPSLYHVFMSFNWFDIVLLRFTHLLPNFNGPYLGLPNFTGFLSNFTEFQWILPIFT